MPEEGIETQEIKENLEEAAEKAEGGEGREKEKGPGWMLYLSLSTALIAVFAAIASLESGSYANDSIVEKNEAIFNQTQASDQWAYYQAKGIKSTLYGTQAEVIGASNPPVSGHLDGEAKREKGEQETVRAKAEDFEKKAETSNVESEHSLHTHHQFAKAVTIFQVAIALAAIGALTKRRLMWIVSLGVGAGGVFYFAQGFGLFGH